MHIADGGQMESTKGTSPKQGDKRNSLLMDYNKLNGDENACWKLPAEQEEQEINDYWQDKLPNDDWWWYEAAFA